MRSLFARLRLRPHDAKLVIESQSPVSLSLRNDRTLIVFDRLSRAVTQNGRHVATFGSIHSVQIDAETSDDRPTAWLVTIKLAASQIATITGTRVVARGVI